MRLFVAIRLPEAVVRGLDFIRGRLAEFEDILRYPDVTGFHLTLAFLGELPEGGVEMVEGALKSGLRGIRRVRPGAGRGGKFSGTGEKRG